MNRLPRTMPAGRKQGWFEKGRRYYVDVPVNPVYHALGVVVEWYQRRRVRRDLREIG